MKRLVTDHMAVVEYNLLVRDFRFRRRQATNIGRRTVEIIRTPGAWHGIEIPAAIDEPTRNTEETSCRPIFDVRINPEIKMFLTNDHRVRVARRAPGNVNCVLIEAFAKASAEREFLVRGRELPK